VQPRALTVERYEPTVHIPTADLKENPGRRTQTTRADARGGSAAALSRRGSTHHRHQSTRAKTRSRPSCQVRHQTSSSPEAEPAGRPRPRLQGTCFHDREPRRPPEPTRRRFCSGPAASWTRSDELVAPSATFQNDRRATDRHGGVCLPVGVTEVWRLCPPSREAFPRSASSASSSSPCCTRVLATGLGRRAQTRSTAHESGGGRFR
jgi:hypothetical protein